MTVIEALQLTVDESGDIVIPVGSMRGDEAEVGIVTEAAVRLLFGVQIDLSLPLTEVQYTALKTTVPGQWEANWAWYRENRVITVLG